MILNIILGLIIAGLLILHIRRTRYYKEAINELLYYIEEEDL